MSEYDIRQYRLMLEITKKPISSMSGLIKAINDLQALLSTLEEKDNEWLSAFMHEWWILEENYAYNRSENIENLTEMVSTQINISLQKLAEMVDQKIQKGLGS